MGAQRPAAQADTARVVGANAVVPGPPERQLRPALRAGDGVDRFGAEPTGVAADRQVGVADPHRDRLIPLQRLSVGVLAVPGEGGLLVRRRGEGLLVELSGDADLELDPPQAGGDGRAAERDVQPIRLPPAGDALALVGSANGVPTTPRASPSVWFWHPMIEPALLQSWSRGSCLPRVLAGEHRVGWRHVGPVCVPRTVEVGDQDPPQALARRVERSDLRPLRQGDAERGQGARVIGHAVAVDVQAGLAAGSRPGPRSPARCPRRPRRPGRGRSSPAAPRCRRGSRGSSRRRTGAGCVNRTSMAPAALASSTLNSTA